MMKVLVLNSGSSSVKFQLFKMADGPTPMVKGIIERVGQPEALVRCSCKSDKGPRCDFASTEEEVPDHHAAIDIVFERLVDPRCGAIEDLSELSGIGHRVVHGGERFTGAVRIDEHVIEGIEKCAQLAPLHNPPALLGIWACSERLPSVPQVAVFDTAFHHTLPKKAFLYGIPLELYEKYGIRKYGFHGISHGYVSQEAARVLGRDLEELRIITCHLGNGCSVTAVEGGRSVDTSMGLTPLGGVMMGTRPGDLDPYIPIFMIKELGMTVEQVEKVLNKESGLEGICRTPDMRDVIEHLIDGDEQCELALAMFAYRIAMYIGAYGMVMNGVDVIVFTGGIGERDPAMRARVLSSAHYLGADIDYRRNARNEVIISEEDSAVKLLVIPTNEERVIAEETARIVGASALHAVEAR